MAKLRFRDAKESDIPWLVDRHIALYSSEAGFNDEFGPVVSNALQHYFDTRDPERERAFVPVPNNGPVGSLFLTRSDAADCAQIRLFWLEPEWRGQGLAQRMLSCAYEFACS
ncbi:MAG: GNAT family N-acetyltransferase, partial [Pseudomonadota bacterium]